MIASNTVRGVFPNPLDAGHRVRGIVNRVAQKQAHVKRFVNRRQRGPVSVNVSKQKDLHGRGVVNIGETHEICGCWIVAGKGGRCTELSGIRDELSE